MTATPMVRTKLDVDGNLERAWIPSRSQQWTYEMVRLQKTWAHTDTKCTAWVERGECYHIRDLEGVSTMTDEETGRAITVQLSPLALMDDIDITQLMTKKLEPAADWIYSFNVKGQNVTGVSARGVQDAARALSTQGEAIRVLDVRLEREDDKDAYFIATAARFAISPTGAEIETDRTIRAKRQPKYMKLRDGGEQFNEFWFEIGVTKASRNATEALLPAVLRDYMKAQAKALVAGKPAPSNGNRTAPADGRKTHSAPPATFATSAVKGEIVALKKRLDNETDAAYVAKLVAELKDGFPDVFTETGAINARASEGDLSAIRDRMLEALGEKVEVAQGELV